LAPKARILAIDDQPYFRSLIEALLSEEGYSVRTTARGSKALEALEQEGPFDLVVMDLVTPAADGIEQIAQLRERWPEQEVIVLTGLGDVPTVVAAMKQGAADYLLKPIDRESLVQSIACVLGNRKLRVEHAHIVDQNLEFMGRLSLLERALPLHGLTCAADVGRALLELLCIEAQAKDGVLWMREAEGGALRRTVARGMTVLDEEPEEWPAGPESLQQELQAGRPTLVDESGRPEEQGQGFFVPCVREGELLAVARLSGRASDVLSVATIEACEKVADIGALAILKAFQMADLQQRSFKDALTGLPSRAFIELVAQTEIHKACRYGRRLSCLRIKLDDLPEDLASESLQHIVSAMTRTLRTTDTLAAESSRSFWVLVTDTDPFGGVVLKRRLSERLREALEAVGIEGSVALGVASYPLDGESVDDLTRIASERLDAERTSVVHELGIQARSPLAEIEEHLLERATPMPAEFVAEAAEIVIGDVACRPQEQGLLFLAPGSERNAFLGSLKTLSDTGAATEVFLATDGDTVPSGQGVTALALPPEVSPENTWIVRFGEAPAYALVAGPPGPDGSRPVYHSGDDVLVEHLTFRLRTEVGFGVRT
jgi:DNA-binding response OmpR family regulator/GGDEF domain-containing protein